MYACLLLLPNWRFGPAFPDKSQFRLCRGKQTALDVALGLAYLHSHNVLHLDIKVSMMQPQQDFSRMLGGQLYVLESMTLDGLGGQGLRLAKP